MKQLIITADDFGLTNGINEGIVKAYKEGVVTFLSFIPTGEAFEDALRLMRNLKLDSIGAHLSLTETSPLTEPGRIPGLVAKDNGFYKSHNEFFLKLFLGKIRQDEIYIELKRQLDTLEKTGLKITNLSSHEYIHIVPEILNIFVRLAKEYDIPSIRYPHKDLPIRGFKPDRIYRSLVLSYFDKRMKPILDTASIIYPEHFLGFLDSGKIRESSLIDMVKSLSEGATEIICHPGFLGPEILDRYRWHLSCEEELYALTSPAVKKIIKDKGIKLINYKEFLSGKC